MNLIIRKAKIVDPKSPFHNQTVDVKITKGIIEEIGVSLLNIDKHQEFQHNDLHLSQGWFDTSVSLGEPGFEDRETIANGLVVDYRIGVRLQGNSGISAFSCYIQSVGNGFSVFKSWFS